MIERGPSGSELFSFARSIVRAAQERAKPSAERLPGYADSQLPLLEKQVLDPRPVYADLEQLTLEFWLSKAREYMTADGAGTKLLLGRDSPEMLSARLAASRLGDPAVRKALWEGGLKAVQASEDHPMIQYLLKIDPEARRLRTAYDERVNGPITAAAEKIAKARFAVYGDQHLPGRHLHPARQLREDRRLDLSRRDREALHHLRRPLRAGHRPGPLRAGRPLGGGQG